VCAFRNLVAVECTKAPSNGFRVIKNIDIFRTTVGVFSVSVSGSNSAHLLPNTFSTAILRTTTHLVIDLGRSRKQASHFRTHSDDFDWILLHKLAVTAPNSGADSFSHL
jgi:hypothetical protein